MTSSSSSFSASRRIHLLTGVVLVFLGLLLARLWQVQLQQGAEHVSDIKRQSIRPIRLNPLRGRILARDGTPLADREARLNLIFHVSEMRQAGRKRRTIGHIVKKSFELARMIGRPAPLTPTKAKDHLYYRPAMPLTVFKNLSDQETAILAEMTPPVRGMEIAPQVERQYPLPGIASHVLGIAARQTPSASLGMKEYRSPYVTLELHGRTGLERKYDEVLAGTAGAKLVRVNTLGYVHEVIGVPKLPVDGKDLVLTLDLGAQRAAELVLRGHTGALVLLDIHTGGVLAMASSPTYDLSKMTGRLETTLGTALNRAVGGSYMPGSIVKPLTALAALECGAIDTSTVYECTGAYKIGKRPIRCARRYGHGELTVVEALRVSCNPFFINAGILTGLDRLIPIYEAVGIGENPRIDLPPPIARGIRPNRAYVRRVWNETWNAHNTALVSIGQGVFTLSPLQAAMFCTAIANGGRLYRPYLVQSILNPDGSAWSNTAPTVEHRLPVKPAHIDTVRKGMTEVVNATKGSGRNARNNAISLAGKTGTAEVGPRGNRHKNTWFICFGPVEDPQYAFACVIERGESGGKTVAPIAKRFFEQWLLDQATPGHRSGTE